MHINNVHIENYRNFTKIDIPLSQTSLILGKNDSGKTNFLEAISLVLSNGDGFYKNKELSSYDINDQAIAAFKKKLVALYADLKAGKPEAFAEAKKAFPSVIVTISFSVDKDDEMGKAILSSALKSTTEGPLLCYSYQYHLKDLEKFDKVLKDYIDRGSDIANFPIPTNCCDYRIFSPGSDCDMTIRDASHLTASIIFANRDSFSENANTSSTYALTRIIEKITSEEDRNMLEKQYDAFFEELQKLSSFKEIFKPYEESELPDLQNFFKKMSLTPNANKYQSLLSNYSIGYGDKMLFQEGLGTRNLILILTLFSYYLGANDDCFRFLAIEEPESHLSVEHYKLLMDYLEKIEIPAKKHSQLVLTSHSNQIVNKAKLEQITVLCSGCRAESLSGEKNTDFREYLRRRPNFDTLNLLFSKNSILVEGITEEIYLTSLLSSAKNRLSDVDIITAGQRGFTTFLDIWLSLHKGDNTYKIAVVTDKDAYAKANAKLTAYGTNENIKIEISPEKTFEPSFVKTPGNLEKLNTLFSRDDKADAMATFLEADKGWSILQICDYNSKNAAKPFAIPDYIAKVIDFFR